MENTNEVINESQMTAQPTKEEKLETSIQVIFGLLDLPEWAQEEIRLIAQIEGVTVLEFLRSNLELQAKTHNLQMKHLMPIDN